MGEQEKLALKVPEVIHFFLACLVRRCSYVKTLVQSLRARAFATSNLNNDFARFEGSVVT